MRKSIEKIRIWGKSHYTQLIVYSTLIIPVFTIALALFGFDAYVNFLELSFSLPCVILLAIAWFFGISHPDLSTSLIRSIRTVQSKWIVRAPIYVTIALGIVLTIGLLIGRLKPAGIENTGTLILAALLDIPAIFVFAVTTVGIEEVYFRVFLGEFLGIRLGKLRALFLPCLIWTLYNTAILFSSTEPTMENVIPAILFSFAIGLAAAALYARSGSVWPGYIFRLFHSILCIAVLGSRFVEVEPFFESKSPFFLADGYLMTILYIVLATSILFAFRSKR